MRAHRLLKIVAARAELLVSATNESVMRAYFSEGQDIGDTSTLVECARRAGFGNDLADDAWLAKEIASTAHDDISAAIDADFAWNQANDVTAVRHSSSTIPCASPAPKTPTRSCVCSRGSLRNEQHGEQHESRHNELHPC